MKRALSLMAGLWLCLLTSASARAADAPCSELAGAVNLSSLPSDDRRQFCQFTKDTVAGGCCQSSLYVCLKSKPTCSRSSILAEIGKAVIETGATEEKAVAAAAAYEDGFAIEKRNTIDPSKAPCEGPKNGLVLAEFSDFDCPHCAVAAPLLQQLVAKGKGQGQGVRLCSFMFPLPGHHFSQLASAAALYADSQGKFWPMAEALFATQSDRAEVDEEAYKNQLLKLGKKIGLDPLALAGALKPGSSLLEKVKDQQMLGIGLLLQGTPSFFLEGHSLNGIPLSAFGTAIRDERESKGQK